MGCKHTVPSSLRCALIPLGNRYIKAQFTHAFYFRFKRKCKNAVQCPCAQCRKAGEMGMGVIPALHLPLTPRLRNTHLE